MNRLIPLLKLAHSLEVGAYHAYEGHWRTVKGPSEAKRIKQIQEEENFHRQQVHFMLDEVKSKPSFVLDLSMFIVGKTVSALCYVMGYRAAMWGANIFEILGRDIYKKLSREAFKEGHDFMSSLLYKMYLAEREHEQFFWQCLYERSRGQKGT